MGQVVIEPAVCDPQSEQSLTALITLASDSASWTERDARYFIDKISQIEDAGTWPRRLQDEPKTWERFCREVLGYDAGYVEKIREGLAVLERDGIKGATIGQALSAQRHAERPKNLLSDRGPATSEEKSNHYNIINRPMRQGDSADYLTARIARDRPDILERMKAGEYKSVRAAALDAGIVQPRISIPTDVDGAARALARKFTVEDLHRLVELLAEHIAVDV